MQIEEVGMPIDISAILRLSIRKRPVRAKISFCVRPPERKTSDSAFAISARLETISGFIFYLCFVRIYINILIISYKIDQSKRKYQKKTQKMHNNDLIIPIDM